MSAPFQSPEDSYFQQLESKLNRIPTWQSPAMHVADDYFDQLEANVLHKIQKPQARLLPLWGRWVAAAVVLVIAGVYFFNPFSSPSWQDFSNEDLVVYLEDHQSGVPWEEMTSQVEVRNLVPLHEISDQDVENYEEIYGI